MRRSNTLLISILLAAAVVAGTVAAVKTVHLGAATARPPSIASAAIAKRRAALDRLEASLRKALARRPPKLPPVPKYAPPPVSRPAAATAPPATPAIRYVRPAPIVVVHHHGGEHEGEGEHDHGSEGGDD